MLSVLGKRKIIVSILTMAFLIVGVQGVSYAQTLSVNTPSVSPTSVSPGGNITLTATVSNTGTGESTVSLLEYYLIAGSGTTPTTDTDTLVGSVFIPVLAGPGSSRVSISLAAPTPSPALNAQNPSKNYYYYARLTQAGAQVGNLSSNARLVVTNLQPNLTVSLNYSFAYNQIIPGPGDRFTLRATVTNTGNGPSTAGATLELFYRPTTFPSNQIPVTSATIFPLTVPALTESGTSGNTSTHDISLLAPSIPGTYNYYVRVTPVSGDGSPVLNPTPVRIITASADLVVDPPTVSKSTLAPGEPFTLTAIVRNNGVSNSSPATLQYYRSTDSTINTTTDTVLTDQTDTISTLSGSNTLNQASLNTSTQEASLTAPTTPATYYYYACVSNSLYESRTDNNCSTTVAITVSAPPDLVAEVFEFRPDTAAPRERLTLDATVRNEGEGQSAATTVRFYESTDRRFTREDEIDRVSVGTIASNGSSNVSVRLIAPSEPGTYYYRVQVDAVTNEEATSNNTSGYIVLFVEAPLTLESVSPSRSTLSPGERFTLTATVANDGTTASARTAVAFYSSADNRITSRDTSIGTDFVSAIAARQTSQASRTLTAPNTPGTYYYGACIGDSVSTGSCMVVSITVVEQTIVANLERPPMYWVDADDGTLQSLTDSEVEPFASGIRNANSIAVDMAGGKVYWTEQTSQTRGRIRRANLDGSNVQLVKALTSVPQSIALDTSNGKLYLTNSWGKVQRMNFNGSNFQSNLIVNLNSPQGIAVDAAGGKIYWTEQTGDTRGRIRRANLDGSNVQLVKALTSVPQGIAVDTSNGKLYLTNSWGKVQRMNFNGSNFQSNLIVNLNSPQGIAVDVAAGKLYWTETGKIRRANLNGSNRQDVVTGIGSLAGIALSVAPVSMEAPAAPSAAAVAPDATALHANYPNPFNPETWIPYQLQTAADVTVTIYDIRGLIVRELLLGHQPAGVYQSRSRAAYWDGRNNLGEPVASGLYFYTLTAGDFSATRKMLIRK